MDRETLELLLGDLARRLRKTYGDRLVNLILFGSRSRGDAAGASDIDVLVVLEGQVDAYTEIKRTVADVADVSLAYDAAVECVFISRDDYDHEASAFVRNVRREGAVV